MKHHRRLLQAAKWVLTRCCAATAIALCLSTVIEIGYWAPQPKHFARICLYRGWFGCAWRSEEPVSMRGVLSASGPTHEAGFSASWYEGRHARLPFLSLPEIEEWFYALNIDGETVSWGSWSRTLWIPIWQPFGGFLIAVMMLRLLTRQPPLPGHCPRCRYDLTDNTSSVCPECGRPVSKDALESANAVKQVAAVE